MAELSPASLVIRPARAGDRDDMLRITRRVWDGTDYVPFRWQRWLNDSSGFLCVAVWNGRVVGLQHTSVQPDGTAWMEGIRVDETMRSRGVGAAMLERGLGWARDAGCSVARLSTSNENPSSVRIAQKSGFREVGTFDVLAGTTSPSARPAHRVRLAHAGDLEELNRLLLHDWNRDDRVRFYTEGWTAYALTAQRLDLLVAVHAVALVESDGIAAVAIATASIGRSVLRLGYLGGSADGMTALGGWMRAQAHTATIEQIRAVLPSATDSIDTLNSTGFFADPAFAMVLWERRL